MPPELKERAQLPLDAIFSEPVSFLRCLQTSLLGNLCEIRELQCYCCRTYLKKGRGACDAPLINKDKLEQAVLDQIQDQILSEENVRKYIELIVSQAHAVNVEPVRRRKRLRFL